MKSTIRILITAFGLIVGCKKDFTFRIPDLVTTAEKVKEASAALDPIALKRLLDENAGKSAEIEKLREQISALQNVMRSIPTESRLAPHQTWKTGTVSAADVDMDQFATMLTEARVYVDGVKLVWNPPNAIHYAIRQGDNCAIKYSWHKATTSGVDKNLELELEHLLGTREILPIGVPSDRSGFLYLKAQTGVQ